MHLKHRECRPVCVANEVWCHTDKPMAQPGVLLSRLELLQLLGPVGGYIGRFCFGGVVIPLIFPKVPQSSLRESGPGSWEAWDLVDGQVLQSSR